MFVFGVAGRHIKNSYIDNACSFRYTGKTKFFLSLEYKMPKIEVNEKLFFNLLGTKYDYDTLE